MFRLGYQVPDLQRGYLIHFFVADCGTDMKFGYHLQIGTLKDIGYGSKLYNYPSAIFRLGYLAPGL